MADLGNTTFLENTLCSDFQKLSFLRPITDFELHNNKPNTKAENSTEIVKIMSFLKYIFSIIFYGPSK